MASAYDEWAEVYDTVYADVRDDIPFYVDAARRSGGPVLELGCGTGRVTVPIAEAGFAVTGLDSSPAMLDMARRKFQGSPAADGGLATFVEADMADFSLRTEFGLVAIPYRGFLSLLTVEAQLRTLENVRRHLSPAGRLVFNIFVPDPDSLVQDGDVPYHLRDTTDPQTGQRRVIWQQSRYDHFEQIVETRLTIEELGNDGEVARRFYRDFTLRYAHRWEMHHLLVACGFEVVDLLGDFEGGAFDEASTEMLWVAAKAT